MLRYILHTGHTVGVFKHVYFTLFFLVTFYHSRKVSIYLFHFLSYWSLLLSFFIVDISFDSLSTCISISMFRCSMEYVLSFIFSWYIICFPASSTRLNRLSSSLWHKMAICCSCLKFEAFHTEQRHVYYLQFPDNICICQMAICSFWKALIWLHFWSTITLIK